MNVLTLLEMAAVGHGDRIAIGSRTGGMTYKQLLVGASRGAHAVMHHECRTFLFIGENSPSFALALFAAAHANIPFLPLNYRNAIDKLIDAVGQADAPFLVTDDPAIASATGVPTATVAEFAEVCRSSPKLVDSPIASPEDVALLLQTSGTTAAPKHAVLRNRHLTAYTIGAVEFGIADETDAMLSSVPPYHIAAIANLLSNMYAGRRLVYLERFTASRWLELARQEEVTHAMVVPTMLARIVEHLDRLSEDGPHSIRSLAYGGGRMPRSVLERALLHFPTTDFVNGYGLTETSSSVAILGPEDHRQALHSTDPRIRARLSSVGKPLPGVELEVRDAAGRPCPPGVAGEIFVRGPQVSGEYAGVRAQLDHQGWLRTRDAGYMDDEGYLFVDGRVDDTIIRGGENIAPAEIEDVLLTHPAIQDAAVVGLEDEEWGQRIAAYVVYHAGMSCDPDEILSFARARLRSARAPDTVHELEELPRTETGKILRRALASGA